jgi:hypothetical protein
MGRAGGQIQGFTEAAPGGLASYSLLSDGAGPDFMQSRQPLADDARFTAIGIEPVRLCMMLF